MTIPLGFCQCGCGGRTKISDYDSSRYGYVKGRPRRFLAGHHRRFTGPRWKVDPETGCWVWQRFVHEGYGEATVQVDGQPQRRKAHRIVWEELRGLIPEGMLLHHLCENKRCVNPDHLQLISQSDHATLHQTGIKRPDSSSRFVGVYWFSARGRWAAWGQDEQRKIIPLGCFDDELEAARVAREHREKQAA